MTIDELRIHFRTAKDFIEIGNAANISVITASIAAISEYLKEIYKTSSALERAKCKIQYDNFDNIINIINQNGIGDNRVLAFFGIVPSSASASSLSDIMCSKENEKPSVSKEKEENVEDFRKNSKDRSIDSLQQPKETIKKKVDDEKPNYEALQDELGKKEKRDNYEPQRLSDFIGQQHIVKTLRKEIAIAKNKGLNHLDNIMLFGNPGLGKTTLMKLIADELGVKFEKIDCTQFKSRQESLNELQSFFSRIAKEDKPVVIAFDEIHALKPDIQSSLLTLLNDRIYVSPIDKKTGKVVRIPIKEFTFIGATTDDDKILDTIKNRCLRLTFQMTDYTLEELHLIYRNKIEAKGLTIVDAALELCIPRSRGAIRYVNSIVEGLDNALYDDFGKRISTHIDVDVANKYFREKGIDNMGLTEKDIEILNVLKENTGEAISADVLAARVGIKPEKYISEYEKYLINIGFVNVLPAKGRMLTEAGKKYLGEDINKQEQEDFENFLEPDDAEDILSNEPKDIVDELFGGLYDTD